MKTQEQNDSSDVTQPLFMYVLLITSLNEKFKKGNVSHFVLKSKDIQNTDTAFLYSRFYPQVNGHDECIEKIKQPFIGHRSI